MSKKQKFKIGEEVIAWLRHSMGGRIPVRVTIKKITGQFGNTYIVSTDVGGKFPTRSIKKLK